MARRLLVVLLLLALTMAVPAAYKIYLTDGKIINADDKPVIKDGIAYFQKQGLELYLPVDQVDLAKTESGGAASYQSAPAGGVKPPVAVKTINDDQLQKISQRSKLANEGELAQPGYPTEGEGAMTPAAAPGANQSRDAIQSQLADLVSRRSDLQKQMLDLQSQVAALRDRDATSTNLADKNAAQQQMSAVQSQLDSVRAQMTSLEAQIQNTQQRLASIPVIVEGH
jgi:hypothetical protein